MDIFLTGATGYIGSAVAEALVRAGHSVVAAARSDEQARELGAKGYRTARADLRDPASLATAATAADGVIHTAFAWAPDSGAVDHAAVAAMVGALDGSGKPFLYTSGVWVMGDTGGRVAGEMVRLVPAAIVAWRPEVERIVLDAVEKQVRGIVIRPAMVHGRGGGMVSNWVRQGRDTGVVHVVGNGANYWTFIHVEDLADLYVLALEKSGPGELYLAADGPAIPVGQIALAAARAAGHDVKVEFQTVEQARERFGLLADALVLDSRVGSTKAGRLLGWTPSRPGILEDLARV
ncbi:MAG: NAD-dependent epimerase/dehydratase family protein [Bryobacterales bacterium]|nr:NAD-dependent epimerase/dehydratase family protein [Bryobacterales bacterium]